MNIVYFPLATEQKEHFHVVSVTEDIIHFHLVGTILYYPNKMHARQTRNKYIYEIKHGTFNLT